MENVSLLGIKLGMILGAISTFKTSFLKIKENYYFINVLSILCKLFPLIIDIQMAVPENIHLNYMYTNFTWALHFARNLA